MLKQHKTKLIITSLVILLPTILGLIFWDKLPESMPRHWGINGNADAYSGKGFTVFVLPLMMLAFHWTAILITAADKKNQAQNSKVFTMVLWMIPVMNLALFFMAVNLAAGSGLSVNFTLLPIALMFIIIGNYMPKCRQNYTIGIKVRWALANEENWNATHRVGGRMWVAGGIVLLLMSLLPEKVSVWGLLVVLPLIAIGPILYSWLYYKKQVRQGRAPKKATVPMTRSTRIISAVLTVALAVFLVVLLFTGNISFVFYEDKLSIEADHWADMSVDYAEIDSVEYVAQGISGSRTNGYGSARLLMGRFNSDELGGYTRYTYTQCESSILIRCGQRILVISGKNDTETQSIYNELLSRIAP